MAGRRFLVFGISGPELCKIYDYGMRIEIELGNQRERDRDGGAATYSEKMSSKFSMVQCTHLAEVCQQMVEYVIRASCSNIRT